MNAVKELINKLFLIILIPSLIFLIMYLMTDKNTGYYFAELTTEDNTLTENVLALVSKDEKKYYVSNIIFYTNTNIEVSSIENHSKKKLMLPYEVEIESQSYNLKLLYKTSNYITPSYLKKLIEDSGEYYTINSHVIFVYKQLIAKGFTSQEINKYVGKKINIDSNLKHHINLDMEENKEENKYTY